MAIRYILELTEDERTTLENLTAGGTHPARRIKRAQILLAADSRQSDEAIAAAVSVGVSTVYRTKRRFVQGNVEHAPRSSLARIIREALRTGRVSGCAGVSG